MQLSLNVLIVDDEPELVKSIVSILNTTLPEYRLNTKEASNGKMALDSVKKETFDLVLMDVRMPEMDGLEALKTIKEVDPRITVVIMTAHSNLQDAITAIKHGAFDYIEKPIDPEKLSALVKKAIVTKEMVSNLTLSSPILDDDIDSKFVGASEKMREIFHLINRLANVDTTVLIRGENGTGKELVARAIHSNSPQKHGPFVAINCGAIPENLMESELFGHERGSFTGAIDRKIGKFQLANKGTLFLDEVGELEPDLQVKLLRVLQERKFMPVGSNREVRTNARIIAATNRNLEKMIEESEFREDFFYRLNVMPIFLPPLRERLDDIAGLVNFFINKFSRKLNRSIRGVTTDTLAILKKYRWPGNIRELENCIERAFIIENGPFITPLSLPENILREINNRSNILLTGKYSGPLDYDIFKEAAEKEFIESALRANEGKINKTVAHANIPKNTLLRKIKKYSIDVSRFAKD
ncbi:MAG: two-component system response regulator [Bdellovibrionales bacterium RBG_16_40_8]|nr:MAG: two-component system response regulator [Bdellovibrionales bacterium RBG_16_40_8]